jgi:O-antigen ligase/polysaccharide polymerase Wzy-like membrane protein
LLRPHSNHGSFARLSQKLTFVGLFLYVAFAPHSVAASAIGIGIAILGWILRTIATRHAGLRRSGFDLIVFLLLLWTFASAVFSTEPSISIPKLEASWCVVIFYLTRAVVTKRIALLLVCILILSACAGVVYSVYDLLRGRGVVVETMAPDSPFRQVQINPGDTVWRVNGKRVYSVSDIDSMIKSAAAESLTASVISHGEQVERPGIRISSEVKHAATPSGLTGESRSHRFRASGWTRHYETFAEILQIVAQLAFGLALANLRNHGSNKYFKVALVTTAILGVGIALTAMRTVLLSFVVGASVIVWRSLRGTVRLVITAALFLILGFGAVVVWQTRAEGALSLADPSSSLRTEVARVGFRRIWIHPILGHGMDAMKLHWTEWGFPGKEMLHLHSTPLQLAFDRGLPLLALWVWLMLAFLIHLSEASRKASDLGDTNSFGILLGAFGALVGFLVSSLVNYNYGDAEVAMLFWWLMGSSVAISQELFTQN